VEWSYQLLDEHERRVFRHLSMFPGPFTLEGADAVAGVGAEAAVLRLVDCSLVSPPRPGPDGRYRYVMLETLRAYGAGLLAQAGEQGRAAAALAGWALRVAEEAADGLQSTSGELAAGRWLDAEDATTRQVLAWAADHDADIALRLAVALSWWWLQRGRVAEGHPLLREAARHAVPGDDAWCAAHLWLGRIAMHEADFVGALGEFTMVADAIADAPPSRVLRECLAGRSMTLLNLGQLAEAAEDGRRSLALARELGDPVGEALALDQLSLAALRAGDRDGAVRIARQVMQIGIDIPGLAGREHIGFLAGVLTETGDLAAADAEPMFAAGLARCQEAGDLLNQMSLLMNMTMLQLQSGRAEQAAAHLRELVVIATRTGGQGGILNGLECCFHLCAATGRYAEAVTVRAAMAAFMAHKKILEAPLDVSQQQEPLRNARQALGPDQFRAAEERGAAMSLDTAAEYVMMLTAPGPRQPDAVPSIGKLSPREWELVTLVAKGRTDAQIAGQLYISVRTVHTHLDRIRDKTGCRRRADLTRLALRAGLI